MRKPIFYITIFALISFLIIGAGCGKKPTGEKGVPAEEGAATTEKDEQAPSLEEVTQKAKNLGGYKFDVTVTQTNQADMEYQMWVKGGKMRWEGSMEGQNVVYIMDVDNELAHVYMPAQNMAIKQNFAQVQEKVGKSPDEKTVEIKTESPEVLGTEVVDNKTCLLVKVVADNGDVTKSWIWTKHGIPIKTEVTTHTGEVITTMLSDIEFSGISDSKFELPSGVQVREMPSF